MHPVICNRRRCAFVAVAVAMLGCTVEPVRPNVEPSSDGVPQRLVLAVDGIPYGLFAELQAQGHFGSFRQAARMVAPFPSLSDVSFAAIGGSEPPRSFQVMYFDPVKNRTVGNTLFSLSSKAHPNLPADSSDHSSWHRMVGYVAPYHVALYDMHRIGRELLDSHKATFVAYLEQSDAVLHVEGRRGAMKFLLQLDQFLVDLQAQVNARTGRELLVDIVSDHGSTLVKGRNIPLDKQLRSCGYERSSRIRRAEEVAYSQAGIIGSVAVSTKPERVDDVARCLARADGVDLVASDHGDRVMVVSADGGEAEVWPTTGGASEAFTYHNLHGDPLGLLDDADETVTRSFDEASLFHDSLDDVHPDPLRRLWRAFHGAVREPSPILVSLSDGRESSYRSVRAFAWLRGRAGTHGSMTRSASLGILTSNWRDVDDVDCWQAHDALFGSATMAAARERSSIRLSKIVTPAPTLTAPGRAVGTVTGR